MDVPDFPFRLSQISSWVTISISFQMVALARYSGGRPAALWRLARTMMGMEAVVGSFFISVMRWEPSILGIIL